MGISLFMPHSASALPELRSTSSVSCMLLPYCTQHGIYVVMGTDYLAKIT